MDTRTQIINTSEEAPEIIRALADKILDDAEKDRFREGAEPMNVLIKNASEKLRATSYQRSLALKLAEALHGDGTRENFAHLKSRIRHPKTILPGEVVKNRVMNDA